MVENIFADVQLDRGSTINCNKSESTDTMNESKKGEYKWVHGAGRKKRRLPKKGRKKSSVFVGQVRS